MATSNIEWTERVWNPTTGCDKVSPGCKNCYALRMAWRHIHNPKIKHKYEGTVEKKGAGINWTGKINLDRSALQLPYQVTKPSFWFVDSMSDLFHEEIPFEFIYEVFEVMTNCHWHTFQVLTKRDKRALEFYLYYCQRKRAELPELPARTEIWFAKNIWLGVSVENKLTLSRLYSLIQIKCSIRWVSAEPLLEEIDLSNWLPYLKWIVVGGESGPGKRLFNPDWARKIMLQCRAFKIAFFGKQWDKINELPEDLKIREYPKI